MHVHCEQGNSIILVIIKQLMKSPRISGNKYAKSIPSAGFDLLNGCWFQIYPVSGVLNLEASETCKNW